MLLEVGDSHMLLSMAQWRCDHTRCHCFARVAEDEEISRISDCGQELLRLADGATRVLRVRVGVLKKIR
jgi:hypothetical protein